jgi:hypothetical protein
LVPGFHGTQTNEGIQRPFRLLWRVEIDGP